MHTHNAKLNGVVYTPKRIVDLILDHLDYKNNICHKKIIDPACGDGAFLSEVAERWIADARRQKLSPQQMKTSLEKNVWGFDTDGDAIKKCIRTLNEIATKHRINRNIKWNIIKTDSLDRTFVSAYFNSFDFVIGNPPYIRIQHLGRDRRTAIQNEWMLCRKGSTDIFIAFFELGLSLLNKNGKLGYITPNTYLKTKAGEPLRQFLKLSSSLKTLIDFGHHQLFEHATTYSVITVLDKNHKQKIFSLFKGDTEKTDYVDKINMEKFNGGNWILTSGDTLKKIHSIENRGMPLKSIAKIHVGITTLADDFYIFKNPEFNGKVAKITLKDGRTFKIEKSILKPIIKASVLKDPNEEQNRYVIFPYRKENNKHTIIPENELKNTLPLTYEYFLAIKHHLDSRDKGKPNSVAWYAFGRAQGLDTSFERKILTSPINLKPNFIVWEKEEYTFYAGYCIKFDGDLNRLAKHLNSKEMEFYICHISRNYQNNYMSFAKSFIENFGIADKSLLRQQKQKQLLLSG